MRCNRCGNENPETNRFCGTCGASLLSPAPVGAPTEAGPRSAYFGSQPAPRPATPSPAPRSEASDDEVPGISGPSFLGLGSAPPPRRPPNLRHDSHSDSSARNLDYLLQDEEEHRGGAAKIFLILIALLLAGGFAYLRYRHQGLSDLLSSPKKPAVTQPADSSQPDANPPQAATPDSNAAPAPAQPAPATSQPAANAAPAPDTANTTAAAPNPASPGNAAANPGSAAAKAPAPEKSAPGTDANADNEAKPDTSAKAPETDNAADKKQAEAAGTTADEKNAESSDTDAETPAPARPAPSRATAKPSAARNFDQVTEAEKYIYGRGGAKQDCDRGLRMLRPPADKGNVQAMISLGALYSTGVCAPRDLPTAYRWFAIALRKQPDNPGLQENLQRLWGQMTQPERQLAIKLTQ